ncbi:hypothetical protein NP233_g5566 [Leucocoprinus birnbaumii]|uniref:L-lysine 6-oxidase n=1 Tax=Leucocoprinus birnbaumii TaxID=56174 RepID=A0AAD5VSL0_9AGAR|nr:hypothetical protein NP233_g5566 [Leucocoprinus birnbaumii]
MSTEAPKKLNLVQGSDPSRQETYSAVNPDDISYVEIFPPVGITRFGDSEDEFFLAPEVPGHTDLPYNLTKFRDDKQRIRRQAVRFRVYAYDDSNTLLGEINNQVATGDQGAEKYSLNWTVSVANRKAAHTAFQGRYANPPITTLRNPNVQPDIDLDDRTKLIIEAGGKISSTSDVDFVNLGGTFQAEGPEPRDVYLGQLQVDDGEQEDEKTGRLIFVPGTGHAECVTDPLHSQPEIVSEFDSNNWFDSACDGLVKVEVQGPGGLRWTSKHYATVVSGPPKFAWGIDAPTNLYNIMEDIYWRNQGDDNNWGIDSTTYDFTKDIWPVLKSAALISWTNDVALQGHGPTTNGHFSSKSIIDILKGDDKTRRSNLKTRVVEKLRKPDYEDPREADARWMPRLSGDNGDMPDPGSFPAGLQPDIKRFAALTKLQYERFQRWKEDEDPLNSDWSPEPAHENLERYELSDQPEYLTRAILESTIGDPLFPGIEMFWIAKLKTTYDLTVPTSLQPPFRVNYGEVEAKSPPPQALKEGYLTRGLSLPWQCDFMLCATHWWPSTRPDNVVPKLIFDNLMGNAGTQNQFDAASRKRSVWTRGFRDTLDMGQSRTSHDIPWQGNTDMVRYWHFLGIVRKQDTLYPVGSPNATPVTAYVESERLEI